MTILKSVFRTDENIFDYSKVNTP